MNSASSDNREALEAEIARLKGVLFRAGLDAEGKPLARERGATPLDVLLNEAGLGISQADLSGRLLWANPRFCEIVGRPLLEVLGQTLQSLTHVEDRDANWAQIERLVRTGAAYAVDKRYVRPDGSPVWVNNHVSPVWNDRGQPEALLCVTQDITERRRTDEALREKEQQLRLAQGAGGIGVFSLDLSTELLTVTPAYCALFGLEPVEALPAARVEALVLPEDRELLFHRERRARQPLELTTEFRIRQPLTGRVRWISRRGEYLRDAEGKPLRLLGVAQDITERKEIEDALREANERMQLALDADVVIGTWVWDIPHNRLLADSRFARSFGFELEQVTRGMPLEAFMRLIHSGDRSRIESMVAKSVRLGSPYRAEYRVLGARGEYRWVEASGHAELSREGEPLRFPGVIIDIHERKQSELRLSALVEVGDRLRDLETTFAIASTAMDVVGPLMGCNRAAYGTVDAPRRLIKVERDWVAGADVASVSGLHSFDNYGAHLENLKRGETVVIPDVEKDARTAPHAANFIAFGIRALLNVPLMEHGELVALLLVHDTRVRQWSEDEIGFLRHIADRIWATSERFRVMAELRRANEELEQRVTQRTRERDRIWKISPELLVVMDTGARLLSVNPAWSTVLGWREEELVGETPRLFETGDSVSMRSELQLLTEGGTARRFETTLRHKDGSVRHLSWTVVLVTEEGLVYGVGRDVTEQRQTEEQLRQSQKMEAVGKLTGGVAHDFNNLLQVISGNLQLLQRDVMTNERALRRVQNAIGSVNRGAKLASQLLAFARRQPLQPLVLDLGRLVRGMDDLLRRSLGEDIQVEADLSGGLWNTFADPNQLENVLLNLAINARDAMSGSGTLRLAASNAVLDEEYARSHPEVVPGAYVRLSVSDTGAGMSPEVMERAFEPFFTTKPEGRGTGLGLSMVYGFVKQSGGHIELESELGKGTTFTLYLPRTEQQEASLPEVLSGPVEGGSETILVVEDDGEVRATAVEILTELGYRVLKAVDGQSALVLLRRGASVDLLFTDVVMPGPVRSPDLARQAQALIPGLEVLFTSGYTEDAIVHGGRLDPGVHLLSKPYRSEDLARKVRQLLDQRPYPRRVPLSRAPTPAPLPVSRTAPRRLRVLLVEDDEDIRSSAYELLGLLGHDVVAVESAEEALELMRVESFDLLLTDVSLPGKSGVELAREAVRLKPGMRIVVASGHGGAALSAQDALLTAAVVLPKPYALSQLQKILEQVVAAL
jgi:PAS domain S-box-containing protein